MFESTGALFWRLLVNPALQKQCLQWRYHEPSLHTVVMPSLLCVPAIVDDEQILQNSVLPPEFKDTLYQQLLCVFTREKIRIGLKVVQVFEDAL